MNGVLKKTIILTATIIVCSGSMAALADTNMRGQVGLDFYQNGFSEDPKGDREFRFINRTLSNHFLNLSLAGPLVNSNLANYSARANIWGTYYLAKTEEERENEFTNPDLRMYYGQLTMFPARRYPLKLYRTKSYDFFLNYEQGNRSNVEVVQTELAVIRRYRGDRDATGSQFRLAMAKDLTLMTEYKNEKSSTVRKYDFGEDRDISLLFAETGIKNRKTIDTITIDNSLPDAEILVLLSNGFDTTVAPGQEIEIALDSGSYVVDIIPLSNYNPHSFRVNLRADMVWKIYYQEPATPNDIDQETTAASFNLRYDGEGPFTNETFYEYNDLFESNQRMTTYLGNFSNSAGYKLSRNSEFSFLTTYNRNRTIVDTLSSQLNKALTHTSTISYAKRQGVMLSFSHAYNRNVSATAYDNTISNLNEFTNRITLPFKLLKYTLSIRNSASLLSDNNNYVDNKYSTDIHNGIEFRFLGIKLQPKNQFKFSINHQQNPDQDSKELEYKFKILGNLLEHKILGTANFKTEYGYRKKYDDIGSDIKKKYLFDMSIIKRFGKNYRVLLLTIQEKENFGGSTPTAGANPNQTNMVKAAEKKSSYKIDFQMSPVTGMRLGGNYMIINQSVTKIQKLGASINLLLPLIRLPVQSNYQTELRDLEGFPRQTQTTMETKLSYQFRQISLVMTHSFVREELLARTFTFHEINARLTRQFGLF